MADNMYRKSMLERMSSPEQLDKMIVITSPSFWLALAGGALIVVVALIWAIAGRLPVKVEATGICVPNQKAYTLASESGGMVSSIEVEVGDKVEEGQVLVKLNSDAVQQEADSLNDRIQKVEAVTLDSTDDEATADNTELLNLKSQIQSLDMEKSQNVALIAQREAELAELKKQVDAAKAALDNAQQAYYACISADNSNVQMNYSDAQTNYSRAVSAYDSAKNSLDSTKSSYQNTAGTLKENIQAAYGSEGEMSEVISILGSIRDTACEPYQLNNKLDAQTYASLTSLWTNYQTARDMFAQTESELAVKTEEYNNAKAAYENYVASSADKERLSADYSKANTEYNTLYSKMTSIEQTIASYKDQLTASELKETEQYAAYVQQFENARASVLDSLHKELTKYDTTLNQVNITAGMSGTVSEIKVSIGSAVGQGTDVVTIRANGEEGEDKDVVVCYVPISQGKKIRKGMSVNIYPSTVNQQEYGHMEAEVVSVDDYVASTQSIQNTLGDDTLVQTFLQGGSVVGVTCKLRKDDSTASGYYWSSKKGADLEVAQGTLVSADIVIDEKRPISMVIPLLKEKLSTVSKPAESTEGGGAQ